MSRLDNALVALRKRAASVERGAELALPEATGFSLVIVRDRDDAYYQQWLDAREKARLMGGDEDAAGAEFLSYDEADKEQLKEVAKVKGHLLGLLEMIDDE